MATLFGRLRSISRGKGNSAIIAAAYRSCSQLVQVTTDGKTGFVSQITHDYGRKSGLVFSKIFASNIDFTVDHTAKEIPSWVFDRHSLWQRIEDIENRINSELAKEYVVALPKEFTIEQNIELIKDFVETSFLSRGMVVDVNYHADNPNNPHAHIMFPMRKLEINGQGEIDFGRKVREWKTFAVLNQIKYEQKLIVNKHYAKLGFNYSLDWGTIEGLTSTFHHGGIKNLWLRNREIIEDNVRLIMADPGLIIDKLDHSKPVFSSEEIEKEIENVLENSVKQFDCKNLSNKQELESFKAYLQTEKLRMLNIILLSPKLTMVNICDLKGKRLFAKTSQIELENRFVSHVQKLNSSNNHKVDIDNTRIASYCENIDGTKIFFSNEQKEVIGKILTGSDIEIIEGWPGTGKSTIAKEIVRHYQERGYEIVCAAPTNKAAQELESKIGVESYTISSLRMKWQLQRGIKTGISLKSDYYKDDSYNNNKLVISKKTILIIDEISMIDTANFDYLVCEVLKSGAKIIGLGDNNQNHAIGMKGAAAKVIEIAGSHLLTEINRHRNSNERIRSLHLEASKRLSKYQIPESISIYDQLKVLNILEDEKLKKEAIFNRYITKLFDIAKNNKTSIIEATSKIVMIAYTNAEINELNMMVRNSLKRSGIISNKGGQFLSGGAYGSSKILEICEGERIIFKSNQPEYEGYGGVMNNEIATIKRIVNFNIDGSGEFIAEIETAEKTRKVLIKTGEIGRPISFNYAYALTNYAVQGASIDYTLMSIDKYSGYEVILVGLTRHRLGCEIFAAKNTLENEVYKTKNLDVKKVREEYQAVSYEYEGGRKKDIPLWQVGIILLASKRSNLSFAIDYKLLDKRTHTENKLELAKKEIDQIRLKLESTIDKLSKYEELANNIAKGVQDVYLQDEDIKGYNSFELKLNEYFQLNAGDVQFNARDVKRDYDSFNDKTNGENELDLAKYVQLLKSGAVSGNKLVWQKLTKRDQNLILYSYLSKEDKNFVFSNVELIDKLEKQIQEKSDSYIELFDDIKSEQENILKLEGNYLAVKNYLESRKIYKTFFTSSSQFNIKKKELSEARRLRMKCAKIIINNYFGYADSRDQKSHKEPTMSKLLLQLGLNYQTIAKHAGVSGQRHYFNLVKKGGLKKDVHYNYLMKMIENSISRDISQVEARELLKSHVELAENSFEMEEFIAQLKLQKENLIKKRNSDLSKINDYKLYKNLDFNNYMSQIYEEGGVAVIKKLDDILDKVKDTAQMAWVISESPDLLGVVKNRDVFSRLFKTETVRRIDDRILVLYDNLRSYIRYKVEINEVQNRVSDGYYQRQLVLLDEEIQDLHDKSANYIEAELLTRISTLETKSTRNGILQLSKFTNSVTELLREEKFVSLFLSWKTSRKPVVDKARTKNKLLPSKNVGFYDKHPLSFSEVINNLHDIHFESIFRAYAKYINPDGKIVKRTNNIACGSLNMDLRTGAWHRFSSGDKGNIFKFVEHAAGVGRKRALEIVASYAGIIPKTELKMFRKVSDRKNQEIKPVENWMVLDEVPPDAKKLKLKNDMNFTLKNSNSKLIGKYEYRNINNKLLGYTIRLQDKIDNRKIVLPIAYCFNRGINKYAWRLKGFKDKGYKPIYGIEKICKEIKPILIVEGEKTADIAQLLVPNCTVISWMGGAMSVNNVDWRQLKGRDVVIWPDNDYPGQEAALNIKQQIDVANGHIGLCNIVDTKELQLAKKWDLADKLPAHLDVNEEISRAMRADIFKINKIEHDWLPSSSSLKWLEIKGDLDKDHSYLKEIYKSCLVLIAKKEKIDLSKNRGDALRKLQVKYEELIGYHQLKNLKNIAAERANITYSVANEIALYYQLSTGSKTLTHIDKKYIIDTVNKVIDKRQRLDQALIERAGKIIENQVLDKKWFNQLAIKHQDCTKNVKSRLSARSLKEYRDLLKQDFTGNMTNVKHQELLDGIGRASKFLQQKVKITDSSLLKIYKFHGNLEKIHESLVHECRTYNFNLIKKQLKLIDKGKIIKLNNKEFTSSKQYLEYLHTHGKHEFLPKEQIKITINKMKNHDLEFKQQFVRSGK